MPEALVISQSQVRGDSRVRRQIDWLAADGWTVDTLGLGPHPSDVVRTHYEMVDEPAWTKPRPIKALIHLYPSFRSRFRLLSLSRIPREAVAAIRSGRYRLVVFEDVHLIAWIDDETTFGPHRADMHVHLDIHEYHPPVLAPTVVGRGLVNPYYRWSRAHIGSPHFATRTVVADAYADVYEREFGFTRPLVVRNAPPAVSQKPGAVDPDRIRLLYHGGAVWERGLQQIIDALEHLDDRFTMTFMLTGSQKTAQQVREASTGNPRVEFVPAVTVHEVAGAINGYDLEIMFYPPATENLRLALPNKLFEAVQGRLGLVVGESLSMAQVVGEHGNGVVIEGWTGADLARGLNALTADDIRRFKKASDRAAAVLNAEHERETFRAAIAGA
ncbi:MAG TPA: glycosyltransferase [Pseudolysinimonas sp.]|nr:glycosyltransferase [Pseudolysinimonas sp.]